MKYIIGLGNPGLEYRSTKHNVGFEAVKEFAKENGIKFKEKRYGSVIGRGRVLGSEVTLVLPQGYMNKSGDSVSDIIRDEGVFLKDIMVVCDDINLKLGRIRIRGGGSSGGHKGLESIVSMLGESAFPRLRIGIATDVHKRDITRYVLTPFKRSQRKNISHVIMMAKDALTCWVEKGIDTAMNKFNIKKSSAS